MGKKGHHLLPLHTVKVIGKVELLNDVDETAKPPWFLDSGGPSPLRFTSLWIEIEKVGCLDDARVGHQTLSGKDLFVKSVEMIQGTCHQQWGPVLMKLENRIGAGHEMAIIPPIVEVEDITVILIAKPLAGSRF
ncbi:MAG: hypothetical protein N3G78_04085 [Desulfobacterota bacterium]|nr:hypothetical protein [Thermodesulfobacteriota bacterium]